MKRDPGACPHERQKDTAQHRPFYGLDVSIEVHGELVRRDTRSASSQSRVKIAVHRFGEFIWRDGGRGAEEGEVRPAGGDTTQISIALQMVLQLERAEYERLRSRNERQGGHDETGTSAMFIMRAGESTVSDAFARP